ncbi:uncharacterized protein LOC117545594 isoform X3 [Gymnodraco acuticeps]|uniref:Uncharacterized protein LOC117535316 isoform X2 n=1 Tax=Gymnodraco acuticeps TaxID=8218 RepID=A0A6P8SY68_GYMAC|nr:uncharacterized protein LOC117535316 isoform X2 [Gymnodraco acuticeps]XP_034071344.1 uncharacterized protein LOC117545594 isoform X3 [Gymnodraco acuticeps]
MKGLPRQICGNDCGIFMLMVGYQLARLQASVNIVNIMLCFPSSLFQYTLSIVTNAGFQFQERDMPLIRKWWCLLLMELFEIQGHGQRFAFWTLEARSLLEGTLQPIFRVPRPEREQQTPPHPQ